MVLGFISIAFWVGEIKKYHHHKELENDWQKSSLMLLVNYRREIFVTQQHWHMHCCDCETCRRFHHCRWIDGAKKNARFIRNGSWWIKDLKHSMCAIPRIMNKKYKQQVIKFIIFYIIKIIRMIKIVNKICECVFLYFDKSDWDIDI